MVEDYKPIPCGVNSYLGLLARDARGLTAIGGLRAARAVTHHLDSWKTQPVGYAPSALTHPTRCPMQLKSDI